jgi:nitrate/nitrite transport system substrate-binding protein
MTIVRRECEIVSKATYINCDAKTILGRLQGHYDYGDGRNLEDQYYMHFSKRNCNYPQPKYCKWFLTQYRAGDWSRSADYNGILPAGHAHDLYSDAMKGNWLSTRGENMTPKNV